MTDSLVLFKQFYKEIKKTETSVYDNCEIQNLTIMPENFPARTYLEKSSTYIGYKLLWTIKLLLLGKRFPKGRFNVKLQNDIKNEVLNIITLDFFMEVIIQIDASAFFQIVAVNLIR